MGCCPGREDAAVSRAPDGVAAMAPLSATTQQAGASPWLLGFPTLPSAPHPAHGAVLPAALQQQAPVAVPYLGYPEDGEAVPDGFGTLWRSIRDIFQATRSVGSNPPGIDRPEG